ncbi:MAG: c-type cytochrome [Alphaproteobacteria bacterium]|nr:c-type cytochrome [Alphaproteobacteria bacterium]
MGLGLLSLTACAVDSSAEGDDSSLDGVVDEGSDAGEDTVTLDEEEAPAAEDSSLDGLPAHFLTDEVMALDNTPADNPQTEGGVALGRALFYDTRLSANDTVACATCHAQGLAFTDDQVLSMGFEGGLTGRHSMSLVNLRWYEPGAMFWDQRADTLEDQVLMPIQDATEMGMDLDTLVDVLSAAPEYDSLFAAAFGDEARSSDRVSKALAQFVRSLVSAEARYDEGLADAGGDPRRPFNNYTAEENEGKDLFFGAAGCAVCHNAVGAGPGAGPGDGAPPMPQAAIFFIDRASNNGLDAETTDAGLGAVTGDPRDDGLFKSPSLRNVAETAPYMHDGRFDSLEEVVEHYNSGVQPHRNLDVRLMAGNQPRRLNLDPDEVDALVAFLETLTDEAYLEDMAHGDPWSR